MNAIEIKGLRKGYGNFTLGELDFTLPAGCITGLVGENGAGKSTLLRLIVGMIKADAGSLRVLGAPVGGKKFRALREELGYVPDESYFPEMLTPRDVAAVLSRAYTRWDGAAYAALLDRFALPARKPVRSLSRGMRMKLSLAAALAHRPRLLVLDEPTGGLDPVARDGILDILNDFTRDETHAVLLSSHILSDLEKICDYVALLRRGKLLFCEEKDRLTESCAVVRLPSWISCPSTPSSACAGTAMLPKRSSAATRCRRRSLPSARRSKKSFCCFPSMKRSGSSDSQSPKEDAFSVRKRSS